MARLYPPITEEVLPAFCLSYEENEKTGASIKVNFNLNRAVANAEIGGIALRMRTVSTNKYVITENLAINPTTGKSEGIALTYNLDDGTAIFQITKENNPEAIEMLRVGQYYKIQLAFIGLSGVKDIGYWSTVSTIKCVARPSVTIANFNANDANIFSTEIIGEYIQDTSTGDSSEKVYSYRFQLFDSEDNLLDDTGVCLHNSSADISSNSSTDTFFCYRELNEGESYYIVYSVTTINGLSIASSKYQIIAVESIPPEQDITLVVTNGLEENDYTKEIPKGGFADWYPWEEGVIKIYPDFVKNVETEISSKATLTGNFVILRSSSKDNFKTWQEVRRFRLKDEIPSKKIIYDYTVEQGITYRYALQQYNRQQFYSKKIYSYKRDPLTRQIIKDSDGLAVYNDIIADFEDMFLYDGKRQLKIRFNPKVNSIKNDLQEQKIDTIGSKHPFIFRNGNVCYKEFPIAGLLSFQLDNAAFFITDEDYNQMGLSRFDNNLISRDRDEDKGTIKYLKIKDIEELKAAFNKGIQVYRKVTEEKKIVDILNNFGHETLLNESNKFLSDKEKTQVQEIRNKTGSVLRYERINNFDQAQNYFNNDIKLYKQVTVSNNETKDKPTIYNKTDLTSENIMSERYFKLLVLDWLTDGKPKLFRSPTEGNYIVRLLNVSLTPKTELGRMIHEFTCTAYEVADFNYQSLSSLGLLNIDFTNEFERQWFTRNLNEIFTDTNKSSDGYYNLNLENKDIVNFECTGFAPGDKIKIIFKDSTDPLYVNIGTTGTYIYDEGKIIIGISVLPITKIGSFSRSITLSTQGYTSQQFDTIASIQTHTQMGEQLVGPVNDFLKKTVVGVGSSYYTSSNVNLVQGGGEKLKVSEILYFHAKRREVIPIFYNGDDPSLPITNSPTFLLTPFGNGYIRSKTISSTQKEWLAGLNKFTPEELAYERTINEIVEFMISRANKDIFCLFEVYVPNIINNKITDWIPYSSKKFNDGGESSQTSLGDFIYGIYDPWLYEWQKTRNPEGNTNYMGWWPRDNSKFIGNILPEGPYESYDPEIKFYYGDNDIQTIDLSQGNEITLENIRVPESISIGNGAIAEIIYRVQQIDYTIENETNKLKSLKNLYLAAKSSADEKVLKYRLAKYVKYLGDILSRKYTAELQKIQSYEDYKLVIQSLTERARQEQINKLKNYFKDEKNLMNNTLLQLHILDLDLIEGLGLSYENDSNLRIYQSNGALGSAETEYNNFFNDDNFNFDENEIIPKLYPITEPNAIINNQLRNLLYHINNSSFYNLSDIIDRLIFNFDQQNIAIDNQLAELGNRSYISQYLEMLNTQGQDLFFKEINNKDKQILSFESNYMKNLITTSIPIYRYELLYKKKNPIILKNEEIISDNWDEYFYITDSNNIYDLSLTADKDEQTGKISSYSIDNESTLNLLDNSDEDCYLKSSGIKGEIDRLLTAVINGVNQGQGTAEQRKNDYEQKFTPVKYDGGGNQINSSNIIQKYQLGIVQNDGRINKIPHVLETIIDNIYLASTDLSVDSIFNNINWNSNGLNTPQCIILPDEFNKNDAFNEENNEDGEEQNVCLKQYVIDYITIPDGQSESARDIYQKICTCVAYWESNEENLTAEQIEIIRDTINFYKNDEVYNNFINKWKWNNDSSYGGNNLGALFHRWQSAYGAVSDTEIMSDNITELENLIIDYNKILKITRDNMVSQFLVLRERYQNIISQYSFSDNIRDIMQEEKDRYTFAINSLNEIKEFFNIQLTNLQQDRISDGYLQFLETYKNSQSSGNSEDLTKYQQLLAEAQVMMDTQLNEQDSPYSQSIIVNNAWKNYLDALAETYKIEIKERFG